MSDPAFLPLYQRQTLAASRELRDRGLDAKALVKWGVIDIHASGHSIRVSIKACRDDIAAVAAYATRFLEWKASQ